MQPTYTLTPPPITHMLVERYGYRETTITKGTQTEMEARKDLYAYMYRELQLTHGDLIIRPIDTW